MGIILSAKVLMLRAAVIIDYQNVHLTGVDLFAAKRDPRSNPLNPLLFATNLIAERNSRITDKRILASLTRVEVYRGLPSSVHDPRDNASNLEQQRLWTQGNRVTVTHRPLKYTGTKNSATSQGSRGYLTKTEKGIDVLCALAVVRNTQSPLIDLVIMASHDSDLEPAVEEAVRLSDRTKIETASWFNPKVKQGWVRMNPRTPQPIWNNRLGKSVMESSTDKLPGLFSR